MANVWAKLDQAGFFLQEMASVQANRRKFTYELSAFLSTCRSVGYYLRELHGEAWFKQMMRRVHAGEFPHIAYYIEKRDRDVHHDVLDVFGMGTIMVNATLPRPAAPYVRMTKDDDGKILSMVWDDGQGPPTPLEFTEEHRYFFPGGEATGQDILRECVEYFMELRNIAVEAARMRSGT